MPNTGKNPNYEELLAGIDSAHGQREDESKPSAESDQGLGSVGDRVRKIRMQKGLTLSDVASRTGFDEDFLNRLENNDVSPPLGALIKLGKALDMKMGYFISGGATRAYTLVRADERQQLSRRAASVDKAYGYTYQTLAPGKTDRHMEPFLVTLEPSDTLDLSSHEGQEFIFVLEGRMEVVLGDERIALDGGDSIYYDSNVPHQVRCLEGPYTKIIAVLYAYDK